MRLHFYGYEFDDGRDHGGGESLVVCAGGHPIAPTGRHCWAHRNIMREHRRMHRHFVLLLLPTACADLHDAETMTPAKVLDNAQM